MDLPLKLCPAEQHQAGDEKPKSGEQQQRRRVGRRDAEQRVADLHRRHRAAPEEAAERGGSNYHAAVGEDVWWSQGARRTGRRSGARPW